MIRLSTLCSRSHWYGIECVCTLLLFLCMVYRLNVFVNVGSLPYRITYHSFRPMRVTLSAVKNNNKQQRQTLIQSNEDCTCTRFFLFSLILCVRHLICSLLVKFFMPIFLWFLFRSIHFVHYTRFDYYYYYLPYRINNDKILHKINKWIYELIHWFKIYGNCPFLFDRWKWKWHSAIQFLLLQISAAD